MLNGSVDERNGSLIATFGRIIMNSKANVKPSINGRATKFEDAKFLASEMLHELKDKVHVVQERAMHVQEDAAAYIKDNYMKVRDGYSAVENKVIRYARAHPLKIVGFSVAAGALISKLFSSRK